MLEKWCMQGDTHTHTHTYIYIYIYSVYISVEIIIEITVEIRGCQRKDKVDFLNSWFDQGEPNKILLEHHGLIYCIVLREDTT